MTAQELIAASLRLNGAIAGGETPTADEYEDALEVLQDILEHWTVEGLTPHAVLDQTFTSTSGVTTYTIGPGATWDGYRPVRVKAVTVNGCPFRLSDIQYNATYPVATITIPSSWDSAQVVVTSELAFTKPTESTDELLLPPGYRGALKHALAVRLAPEYGLEVMPAVAAGAAQLKAELKRANIRHQEMRTRPELQPPPYVDTWIGSDGSPGSSTSGDLDSLFLP